MYENSLKSTLCHNFTWCLAMRILVTGGGGYIGSVLVDELLKEGHEVTVLDNLIWGIQGVCINFGKPRFTFVEGDVRNDELVCSVLKGQDVVVHLAALVGENLCKTNKAQASDVNVNGTRIMEKCLSDDQLLVFASTGSVYGLVNGTNCPEETVANPLSHYAATKIQAEKIVSKKKNAVILRFATAFGVSFRMRLDLLVNQFVYEAVKYRTLLVYGEKSVRSVIHVRDIAQSILFTIKHRDLMPGQVFNVGSSSLMFTKGQIARQIKNQIEYDLQFGESCADLDRRNYSLSTDKIEALGYRTKVSLDEGLFELISTVKKIKVDKSYFNSGIASEYTDNSRLLRQLSVFGGFP